VCNQMVTRSKKKGPSKERAPLCRSEAGPETGRRDQKSICALTFTKRGDKTDCGVSHVPVGE
jgi:hypothetical protein